MYIFYIRECVLHITIYTCYNHYSLYTTSVDMRLYHGILYLDLEGIQTQNLLFIINVYIMLECHTVY